MKSRMLIGAMIIASFSSTGAIAQAYPGDPGGRIQHPFLCTILDQAGLAHLFPCPVFMDNRGANQGH